MASISKRGKYWRAQIVRRGYGLSLTLFVVGLRTPGTARTGTYFSVAPLFGVLISLLLWPEPPTPHFWAAAGLMGLGVWLHIRERH